jgi:cysteine desulfurase family protein
MTEHYFDNAATSCPKPPEVVEHIRHFLVDIGTNINRGSYASAYSAADTVLETRELLCTLFGFPKPTNVVFTKNITESLNVVIKGLLQPGDHLLLSSLEHNAVLRPLHSMLAKGISYSAVPCTPDGNLDLAILPSLVQANTKAVLMTHASNVSGTILPLEQVGEFCRRNNLYFIIDTAQTAGFLELDMEKLGADALTFTGHKGLLGPMGIGGFLLTDRLAEIMPPLLEGGTGSLSEELQHPPFLPDKYESGTMNIPGVFGLNAALKYLMRHGLPAIREQELALTARFIAGIKNMNGIKIIGPETVENRTAIVSLDFPGKDNADIAHRLARDYQILTRCGLHCSPAAHQTLGTFPQGTVRFSFSHFNTEAEIDYALNIIAHL